MAGGGGWRRWLDSLGVVGRSRVDHPPFVFLNCCWMMDDGWHDAFASDRIGHPNSRAVPHGMIKGGEECHSSCSPSCVLIFSPWSKKK